MSTTIWLHEARSDEGARFRIGRRGDTRIAEWDGLLRLEVPVRGAPRIVAKAESLATQKLREGAIPALLGHLSGVLHWHAAACAWPDRRAVVVLGPSGAGKSTLAAGLGTVGAAFLADDVCAVALRGGAWTAARTETRHAIRPDVVPLLYGTKASTKALFAPERMRACAPLGALLRLEVGPELALREVPPRQRVQLLQQNLIRFALDDSFRLERDLDVVLALAQQVPMYTLVRPAMFTEWARLRDLLRSPTHGLLRDSFR